MEAYQTIGLDALNEMLIENPPFLLDVRNLDETEEKGYIPGSVTIPLRELGDNLQYLPEQDLDYRQLLWKRLALHHCFDSSGRSGLGC